MVGVGWFAGSDLTVCWSYAEVYVVLYVVNKIYLKKTCYIEQNIHLEMRNSNNNIKNNDLFIKKLKSLFCNECVEIKHLNMPRFVADNK